MPDLSHLPLPDKVRTALRRELARKPGWLSYRLQNGLNPQKITRAQWIAAAVHFDIDIEAMVISYCDTTGKRFVRRRDRELSAKAREWL